MNIAWSDELRLGIESVDAEHQRMLRIADAVMRTIKRGDGIEDIASALHYLREYAEHHFRNEERLMAREKYPGLEKHRREHAALRHEIKELQDVFYLEKNLSPEAFEGFLDRWCMAHILESDRKVKTFLDSRERAEAVRETAP